MWVKKIKSNNDIYKLLILNSGTHFEAVIRQTKKLKTPPVIGLSQLPQLSVLKLVYKTISEAS